jgi:hypothetical protein
MTRWRTTQTGEARSGRATGRATVRLAAAIGAGAMVLFSLPAVAQAANPSKTTFTFSGAVSGKLSQANSDCNEVGSYGGMFEFEANKPLLKGSKDKEWVVNVNALSAPKKGATYKKFGGLTGNGASIVLDTTTGKQAYYWASKSGKLTTSKTGGSLDVKLVPDTSALSGKPGKGDITIVGSWGCEATIS